MAKENHMDLQSEFYKIGVEIDNAPDITLPVLTLKQAVTFGKKILATTPVDGYDDDSRTAIANVSGGSKFSMLNNATGSTNNGTLVNTVNLPDGRSIGPKKLNLKKNARDKATIIDKLTTSLNIGSRVKIPLYHSGFHIAIEPPKATELNNLLIKLNDCRLSITTDSRAFLHTNNKILLDAIIVEFIVSKIIYTSLKTEGQDITKFISIFDVPTLVMAIVSAMYPNGHNFNISCINAVKVVKGKPLCTYNVSGVVDVMETLRVDRDRLTPRMIEILSIDTKDGITIAEANEYAGELLTTNKVNNVLKIELPNNDGVLELIMTHKFIYEYHKNGKKWLNNILDDVDRVLEGSISNKERVIADIIQYNSCNSYKELISSIRMGDSSVDDPKEISDILINLSESKETRDSFSKQVRTYLEKSSITIVGFSNFVCPTCGAKQTDRHDGHVWNTINPVDPFEYFLHLGVSKITSLV